MASFPLPENLDEAVAALRAGELVVFPTETFYGLGADPMQSRALDRIFEVKGRDPDKPIALIAADRSSAFALTREVPRDANRLADAFWPGPLTLVLPGREGLHPAVTGADGSVGVRVSSHPVARELACALNGVITATSANFSGDSPAATISEAQALGTRVRVYVDGGVLTDGAASTVVAFGADGTLTILRAGAIDARAIAAALGRHE